MKHGSCTLFDVEKIEISRNVLLLLTSINAFIFKNKEVREKIAVHFLRLTMSLVRINNIQLFQSQVAYSSYLLF